ncbi:MAG: hypothetical protein K8T91_25010 [Planctomycetes bacterium]|nr:hypothetical protein [Planctomycetota bacterium]
MADTIFYAWQSDLPGSTNRSFIEDCLERAVKDLKADGSLKVDPCVDRDTTGQPGSPDIAETIFEKIDACAAFVGDVSIVNAGAIDRLTPNPNVLIELGRATKSVGFDRIICIFNTITGKVEDLPFDIRKRRVLTYSLQAGEEKAEVRPKLVKALSGALRSILEIPVGVLDLQFAEPQKDLLLGRSIALSNLLYDPLEFDDLPDYGSRANEVKLGGTSLFIPSVSSLKDNRDYYREMWNYIYARALMRHLSFGIHNAGSKTLNNVRIVVQIEKDAVVAHEASKMPSKPKRQFDTFGMQYKLPQSLFTDNISVKDLDDKFKLSATLGKIQPKATEFTGKVMIGKLETGDVALKATIYADELAKPIEEELIISFTTEHREMTFDDIDPPDEGAVENQDDTTEDHEDDT